uniref:Uncharacterized protein n=2 Tax=Dunaliella tertiolecta TaxID=3047 RepID=A0A7S3QUX4_DUNTE
MMKQAWPDLVERFEGAERAKAEAAAARAAKKEAKARDKNPRVSAAQQNLMASVFKVVKNPPQSSEQAAATACPAEQAAAEQSKQRPPQSKAEKSKQQLPQGEAQQAAATTCPTSSKPSGNHEERDYQARGGSQRRQQQQQKQPQLKQQQQKHGPLDEFFTSQSRGGGEQSGALQGTHAAMQGVQRSQAQVLERAPHTKQGQVPGELDGQGGSLTLAQRLQAKKQAWQRGLEQQIASSHNHDVSGVESEQQQHHTHHHECQELCKLGSEQHSPSASFSSKALQAQQPVSPLSPCKRAPASLHSPSKRLAADEERQRPASSSGTASSARACLFGTGDQEFSSGRARGAQPQPHASRKQAPEKSKAAKVRGLQEQRSQKQALPEVIVISDSD